MYRKVLTLIDNREELRKVSTAFCDEWTVEEQSCLTDLLDTFKVVQGLGLAAPQIGIHKRAVVVNAKKLGLSEDESLIMVNPTVKVFGELTRNRESCFSIPYVSGFVERKQGCEVSYLDEGGTPTVIRAEAYAAVCLQHEIDHLDGTLYIDRMGGLSRKMLLKKLDKAHKKKLEASRLAHEAFNRDHYEALGSRAGKKTTHSKKRKPKSRRSKSGKRKKG